MPLAGLLLVGLVLAATRACAEGEASGHAPESIEALMGHFASAGGVRVNFEETRTFSILTMPVKTSGRLYFSPPDRLARVTTHPGSSKVVVNGSKVVVTNSAGRREMSLDHSEVARGLIDNLMVVLRGDLSELRTRYQVQYSRDESGWVLELTPRSRKLRAVVEKLKVSGEGAFLDRIETFEANGDVSLSRFSGLETGLDFDSAEDEHIFSVEPSGFAR